MQKNFSLKLLGIICLATFLQASPCVFAQDDDFDVGGDISNEEPTNNKDKSETELVDEICRKLENEGILKKGKNGPFSGKYLPNEFKEDKPMNNQDPFKPVITKNVPQPVKRVQEVVKPKIEPPKPQPPKIQPIKLFVKGIVGNEGNRLAIVEFEKNEHTIVKDQIVDGKFKVVDIYADRVVVYSNKEQRRHTFKIGGDEKDNKPSSSED